MKELYLESNGFREPLGNAEYLLSLTDNALSDSLVKTTQFWWYEWPNISPNGIDFTAFVFFGMSSADEVWGIRLQAPHDIISYHHHMEDEFVIMGTDILEVFKNDTKAYEE